MCIFFFVERTLKHSNCFLIQGKDDIKFGYHFILIINVKKE